MRLNASNFEGPSFDDELMRDGYVASLPAKLLENVAPDTPHFYDDIDVVWFITESAPSPDDEWLAAHFPLPNDIVSAVRDCFDQYAQTCDAKWRAVVVDDLNSEQRKSFDDFGWLPFVYIERILINAAINVICVECLCEIDPNLLEHEVAIICCDGKWCFGSGDDRYELFGGWDGKPLGKY